MKAKPTSYRFEGVVTRVRWMSKIDKGFREGYPTAGSHLNQVIKIKTHQTWEDERRSLLHEIMHDALDRANIRQFLSLKDEETFVTLIEPQLFGILRENQELRDYLFKEV